MALKRSHESEPLAQSIEEESEAKKQAYPVDESSQWKFIKGVFSQLRKDCPVFGILVIGEVGTGKSTLINNLLGKEVASVGHTMESETQNVNPHEVVANGVPVVVYDTPGLDDVRGDEDEKKHLDIMKNLITRRKIHLVMYCFRMTETRLRRGLIRTLEEYHKIDVPWEQTIIALTFADMDSTDRFSGIQQQLKKTLVERVGVAQSIVEKLKIRPTAKDPSEALPSGRPWYVPFWLDVVEVLAPVALVRFLDIHEGNIHMGSLPTSSQPTFVNVTLAGEDKERYERQISRLSAEIPLSTPVEESQVGNSVPIVPWWRKPSPECDTQDHPPAKTVARLTYGETVGEVVSVPLSRLVSSSAPVVIGGVVAAEKSPPVCEATLVQVIKNHAEEFLNKMDSEAIVVQLRALELIPESVESDILQSKSRMGANAHLLNYLMANVDGGTVREVFRIASEAVGYGMMNTFAAFMLRELR